MSASPRMEDTTRMRHCRTRPRHHSCKGEREVRPSRRNWSSWCLGRVQPGEQKSHPHASLVLLLRCPPCARVSSCLLARLLPWRDMAAELHAPGILHTAHYVSSYHPSDHCGVLSTFSPVLLKDSLSHVNHPPARVGQTRILFISGRGHCPWRQPRSPSVACQGKPQN